MKKSIVPPSRRSAPAHPSVAEPLVIPPRGAAFPVVGVGASAGGLEAFRTLLAALPARTGMAFVLIQHLDPAHESHLVETLSSISKLPVEQITDGLALEPDHVYVIPPNADLGLLHGVLTLLPRVTEAGRPHLPIDFFFRALAADCGSGAIGIVLSGTASDGTDGLRAIKAADGFTLVQTPESAKFSGMPQSALDAGVADAVLSLPALATELLRLGRHPYLGSVAADALSPDEAQVLAKIFIVVRNAVGVDFSEYKQATVLRRLARRMALARVSSFQAYLDLLLSSPGESRALYEDVLIHVTSFFRDPDAFDVLKNEIFPEILRRKADTSPIRLWVAGCSTGEEVYSFAIALDELLGTTATRRPIQIFGSDVSEKAIEKARAGIYSDLSVREISEERRRRYFTKLDRGYRISRNIRDLAVFVRHDLARDPPFSKLDFVSCRNVLIYFDQPLQRRVLAAFHYCLDASGYLMLGRSESISGFAQLFSTVDKGAKVFRRAPGPSALSLSPVPELRPSIRGLAERTASSEDPRPLDLAKQVDRLLLSRYAPGGVVVDAKLDIVQFRGRTGPFLEPPPGEPQRNLLKMARPGLLSVLRLAVAQSRKDQAPVRKDGVRFECDGVQRFCDLVVIPLPGIGGADDQHSLVLFEELATPAPADAKTPRKKAPAVPKGAEVARVAQLEHELTATKEYLQSLLEEHSRTNDDLSSANEELISGNEELQSMNEELETAKEELQSSNEELTTVNDELHSRNDELQQANGDLVNLLGTVEIPILILDAKRRVRRFTPRARAILNVLPSDVGRSIDDIRPNVAVADLSEQVAEVISTAVMKESETQDRDGRWYRMQIRPYKTTDERIDGAIVSLVDIDALKREISIAEWARDYAAGIVEAVQTPLLVLDDQLNALSANDAYYQAFRTRERLVTGRSLYSLDDGAWDVPALREALSVMVARNGRFAGLEFERDLGPLGRRRMALSAGSVPSRKGRPMLLLSLEDVTERRRADAERAELLAESQAARAEAESANRAKDLFLATLSHELRTPLSSMLMNAQLLMRGGHDAARVLRASEAMERSVRVQVQLIDDLLDVSRIVSGKMTLALQVVHLASIVHAALETVAGAAERKAIALTLDLDETTGVIEGDPVRLQQVVWNLLANAIKFTPAQGRITVTLRAADGVACLRVEDTGCGIDPAFLAHVFHRFSQEDSSLARVSGGLGLGLAIVRHIVESHHGTIAAASPGPGKGSTFTVCLPLLAARTDVADAPAVPPSPRPSRPVDGPSRIQGVRLLVVDDDQANREAVAELLKVLGANVRIADSAVSAMPIIDEFRPQVLLCDLAMPGEDGLSFLRRVRALGAERGGDIPAIALSAMAADNDRLSAAAVGFQLHLAKPVDADRLVDGVASVVDRGR